MIWYWIFVIFFFTFFSLWIVWIESSRLLVHGTKWDSGALGAALREQKNHQSAWHSTHTETNKEDDPTRPMNTCWPIKFYLDHIFTFLFLLLHRRFLFLVFGLIKAQPWLACINFFTYYIFFACFAPFYFLFKKTEKSACLSFFHFCCHLVHSTH